MSGCLGAGVRGEPFVPADPGGALDGHAAWQPRLLQGLGDPVTSGRSAWPGTFDASPAAYDFDGDGTDELVAMASDTNVYVFDAFTGTALAVLPTTHPRGWHIERVLNGVEVGILRPGEPASIVVTNHAAYVAAWRFDPQASDGDDFVFRRQFDERMDACDTNPGMDAKPALGDLDGDGELEIVVQTEERGFYALRADGSTLWGKCWGGGNSAPVIADLDGRGGPEVIVGSDAGLLAVLAGASGEPLWTFDATEYGITPASIVVSPTVADLDGELPLEVLFTARHAPKDGQAYTDNHMAIFAVRQDPETYQAEMVWGRQPTWANPMSNTRLVVADVDADGEPDVFGMDWNTIGHYPGEWERLGPAHLFRLTAQGDDVWVRPMDTWWSNKDIALVDLDGQGAWSVIANGPAGPYDGMWRFSADTGAAESFLPLQEWKVVRGPQVVQLRDGAAHLVFTAEPTRDGQQRGAILVFDVSAPPVAAQALPSG